MNLVDRFRLWIAKHPGAVAGNGGHPTTFAVCCRAVEFGLTFDEALPLLLKWNERCQPPWTPAALHHKLASAFRRTHPKPEFTSQTGAARTVARNFTPAPQSMLTVAAAKPPLDLRRCKLTAGNPAQFAALAAMRHVSIAACVLASERALLRFGEHFGKPAWFTLDTSRRLAIARRMDGTPWVLRDGSEAKAIMLAGSQGAWPLGVMESRNYRCIALVEGSGDMLGAHHFIVKEGRQSDCAVVTMFSASPLLIHPEALSHFARKRVRIFTHADENGAGEKAAARWVAQLESAGATVDAYRCGSAMGKDLNDLVRLPEFCESILP